MRQVESSTLSNLVFVAALVPGALAAQLAVVPTDHATIQAAVDAVQGLPGATVRVDSNATFVETVTIHESLVLEAGAGFSPTLQAAGGRCNFLGACALAWNPNAAGATTFVVRGMRFLTSGSPDSGADVVQILNQSPDDTTVLLDRVVIEDPTDSGDDGIVIREDATIPGGNHVTILDTTIGLGGASAAIVMGEEGSLTIGRLIVEMRNTSSSAAFRIQPTSNPFPFSLVDSTITLFAPAGPFSADLGRFGFFVDARIERNTFHLIGSAEGSVGGIDVGTRPGPFASNFLLDGNRFLGVGPNTSTAIDVSPFDDETVSLVARNNVVQGMGGGFLLTPQEGGTIDVTLVNNTVVGASDDAIVVHAGQIGGSTTARIFNNLVTHSAGGGIRFVPGPGAATLTNDFNGFFANADGDLPGVVSGPGDVFGDPLYLNPSNDFHLALTSPMLDRGTNTAPSAPLFDADQEPRIQNGTVDIGAFEGGEIGNVLQIPTLGDLALFALAGLTAAAGFRGLRRARLR